MAIVNQSKTIVGIFPSVQDAQRAAHDLENAGISRSDISVVASKNVVGFDNLNESNSSKSSSKSGKTSDVVADAGIGAAIGGVGGLLLSAAGMMTLPVIGPVLAAGPIVAALTGAGVGAAAGGLIAALTEAGIPEEDAEHYAEGIRRGDVLVSVHARPGEAQRIGDIMDGAGAVDVDSRLQDWKQKGWTGYSPTAQPYSAEELRSQRSSYGENSTMGTSGMASTMGHRTRETLDRAESSMKRGVTETEAALRDAGNTGNRRAARIYDRPL